MNCYWPVRTMYRRFTAKELAQNCDCYHPFSEIQKINFRMRCILSIQINVLKIYLIQFFWLFLVNVWWFFGGEGEAKFFPSP